MQDFSKRYAKRRLLFRFFLQALGVVALGGITFFLVRGTYGMYQKFSHAASEQKSAQERLESLKAQKEELSAAVAEADTHRGIEAQVRERYGVARAGEGRIEIVRESASSTPGGAGSDNFFVKFFDFLWPF